MSKKIPKFFISNRQKWLLSDKDIWKILTYGVDTDLPLKDHLVYEVRHIVSVAISLIVILRVALFYFKQFFYPVINANSKVNLLILDSGRGYGTNNINTKLDLALDNSVKIYLFEIGSYMKTGRVNLFTLLRSTADSIIDYYQVLSSGFPKEVDLLILKKGISNVSIFSYLKAFFEEFDRNHPSCSVYTDAGVLQSHASIAAGIKTVCVYHGITGKNVLSCIPEYDSIYVHSQDEKEYLIDLGVKSNIYTYPSTKIGAKNDVVIFFMPFNVGSLDYDKVINDLVMIIILFKSFSYKIYLKLHPLTNAPEKLLLNHKIIPTDWKKIFVSYGVNYISTSHGDASIFMSKLKPRFIVSRWGSTVFAEALNMDIIPISIAQSTESHIIYPFHKRSLAWPESKEIVTNLLSGKGNYSDTILNLKSS